MSIGPEATNEALVVGAVRVDVEPDLAAREPAADAGLHAGLEPFAGEHGRAAGRRYSVVAEGEALLAPSRSRAG
jgi:hypothetical protein